VNASGLVYAAIVVMWAAVLIPMWVRRHDASTEHRSEERFGQAMRVLSRRPGTADRREIVVPRRRAAPTAAPAAVPSRVKRPVVSRPVPTPSQGQTPAPAAPVSDTRPRPPRSQRAQARAELARRRARSLAVLGVAALLMVLLAVLSVVPVWAPVMAGLLLVAFVVHLRVQAKRAAERRRPTARTAAPSGAEPMSKRSRSDAASAAGAAEPSRDETGLAAPVDLATASEPSWQPNPLPLPTYVTAPKAVRPIRVIDLTSPGAWTSGRLLEDEVPVVEDTLADEAADAEALDALLEQDVALDAERHGAAEGGQPPSARAVGD